MGRDHVRLHDLGEGLGIVRAVKRTLRIALGACIATVLGSSEVRASAFVVNARTEAQLYQIRSYRGTDPVDPIILPRRRIVQYLGLDGFELVTGEDLGFETNLRVFTDFGVSETEAERIDGLRAQDADLLYAHLNYKKGGFEGRLGRQFLTNVLEYMSMDGARLRYMTPLGLGAEAYGGLWVKGTSLLGSPTHALDGIREAEGRVGVDALIFEQEAEFEPVFGARLVGENVANSGVSGFVGYRRSNLAGEVNSERLGAALDYTNNRGLNVLGAVEYDLFIQRIAQARARARYDQDQYAATIEALRIAPTFAASSIWLFFATAPRDELKLRGDYTPVGPFRYYAEFLVDRFNTEINENIGLANALSDPDLETPWVLGAGAGAHFLRGPVRSGLDVLWRNGYGGRQFWVDLTGGYQGANRRWSVDGRISIANVDDARLTLLRGTFYGAQLWGSYVLAPAARISLVVEQNVNPFTQSDTRAYAVFDLKAVL